MHTPMPTASLSEIIASATRDILHMLQNPMTGSPLPLLTDMETETLKQISILLNKKTDTRTVHIQQQFNSKENMPQI